MTGPIRLYSDEVAAQIEAAIEVLDPTLLPDGVWGAMQDHRGCVYTPSGEFIERTCAGVMLPVGMTMHDVQDLTFRLLARAFALMVSLKRLTRS